MWEGIIYLIKVIDMLGVNSKASLWGCMACYNRTRKDVEAFCSIAQSEIRSLSACPIGGESFTIISAVYSARKFTNMKIPLKA